MYQLGQTNDNTIHLSSYSYTNWQVVLWRKICSWMSSG